MQDNNALHEQEAGIEMTKVNEPSNLPKFKNPPVIEVVCGLRFKPLERLLGAHVGTFWEEIKQDYPDCKEMPPVTPVYEQFEGPTRPDELTLEFTNIPPMARTWLIHKEQTGIIQIQRDQFHHNWRKVKKENDYPQYSSVIESFRKHLDLFKAFIKKQELGSFTPIQYEMTYVNHISCGEDWCNSEEAGKIFTDFTWRKELKTFLPVPEIINWRTSFRMPGEAGRLHVSINFKPQGHKKSPYLILTLTCRGTPKEQQENSTWDWFDLAHEWIVRSFCDMTTESIRKEKWEQIQ